MSDKLTFYALINDDNIVVNTFVMDHDKAQSGLWGNPSKLIEYTNYTYAGVYYGNDGVAPLRYNTAGIGYVYDPQRDAFYLPQPFPSWTLNGSTCLWEAPIPYPNDGKQYIWDEATQSWVEVT